MSKGFDLSFQQTIRNYYGINHFTAKLYILSHIKKIALILIGS